MLPQAGHTNPSGHRHENSAARHFSSVPYNCMKPASDRPFWNWTLLRAMMRLLKALMISVIRKARSWLRIVGNQDPLCNSVVANVEAGRPQTVKSKLYDQSNWSSQLRLSDDDKH